jgi:hypothetical protein
MVVDLPEPMLPLNINVLAFCMTQSLNCEDRMMASLVLEIVRFDGRACCFDRARWVVSSNHDRGLTACDSVVNIMLELGEFVIEFPTIENPASSEPIQCLFHSLWPAYTWELRAEQWQSRWFCDVLGASHTSDVHALCPEQLGPVRRAGVVDHSPRTTTFDWAAAKIRLPSRLRRPGA